LNSKDLENFYGKRLFDNKLNTNSSTGLGFIDLRTNSGSLLNFDIRKLDEKHYFFTLKTKILKQ